MSGETNGSVPPPPQSLVGRLIGKQGRYVSYLKQNSGAKIYISTLPYTQEFQICHIEGESGATGATAPPQDLTCGRQPHLWCRCRYAGAGGQSPVLDREQVQGPGPDQPVCPAPPAAHAPLATHDVLGKTGGFGWVGRWRAEPLTCPPSPQLLLPSGVTVEVIVVNIVSAGHVFVQQHTHPTYHALRSLDQQMFLCYSQPSTPPLPSPAESRLRPSPSNAPPPLPDPCFCCGVRAVGVICAAPAGEGAWWRAQVITFYKDANEVEIRYVDYGGYDRVKMDSLRQIRWVCPSSPRPRPAPPPVTGPELLFVSRRSDFVTLPFQGAEVLLDNVAPLPGEDRFSAEATAALEEVTRGVALLAQVKPPPH